MKTPKVVAFPKRKPIPPSIRFAVFKRDAFTCQYCGAKAPDVLLQCDHIKPVADGGENEVINLITSCAACNGGKGAEPLDENAIIEKQRKQLEELNERRNQLEMMLKWREGLRDIEGDYIQAVQSEFLKWSPFTANESGIRDIRSWLKKFNLQEVLESVEKACSQYLESDGKVGVTSESWNKAFAMVPRIAGAVKKFGPASRQIFYIRAIVRNRFDYGVDDIVNLCAEAAARGADMDRIVELAKTAPNFKWLEQQLTHFISHYEREDG